MNIESFRAASEAAESWARDIADARYFVEQGDTQTAYGLLWRAWLDSEQHEAILDEARESLAAVSDGVIRHYRQGTPRCYASAHEAVHETLRAIFLLILSCTDVRDAAARRHLEGPAGELLLLTSDLRAHIRRERAKLLAAEPKAEVCKPGAEPLTETEQQVFEVIARRGPVQGAEILGFVSKLLFRGKWCLWQNSSC